MYPENPKSFIRTHWHFNVTWPWIKYFTNFTQKLINPQCSNPSNLHKRSNLNSFPSNDWYFHFHDIATSFRLPNSQPQTRSLSNFTSKPTKISLTVSTEKPQKTFKVGTKSFNSFHSDLISRLFWSDFSFLCLRKKKHSQFSTSKSWVKSDKEIASSSYNNWLNHVTVVRVTCICK